MKHLSTNITIDPSLHLIQLIQSSQLYFWKHDQKNDKKPNNYIFETLTSFPKTQHQHH